MFPTHPLLTTEAESQPGAYVIRITGELDVGSSPDLESALQEAERAIVDLEALTFIDSIGLRTLLKASRRSATDGNCLEVAHGKGQPAAMFRLTGLDRALPLTHPSLCPAVRNAGCAPEATRHGRARAGTRWVPDDANLPRTGETVIAGPTAWC